MLNILIFFFLSISFSICQDDGLDAYNSGDMIKARNIYEKLYKKVPDNEAIKFGLGTTAFRQNDKNTAKEFLGSVKNSNDPILASKAFYNLGELFTSEDDFENGLLMYKKAIILNPNDKDAKINYELLKRKIQNQDKQNQDEQNKKMQAEAILNALQKKEQINQKLKISKSKTRNLVKDW